MSSACREVIPYERVRTDSHIPPPTGRYSYHALPSMVDVLTCVKFADLCSQLLAPHLSYERASETSCVRWSQTSHYRASYSGRLTRWRRTVSKSVTHRDATACLFKRFLVSQHSGGSQRVVQTAQPSEATWALFRIEAIIYVQSTPHVAPH